MTAAATAAGRHLIACALLALAMTANGQSRIGALSEALVGKPAPAIPQDGIDWAALEGRVVVLAFWATWCEPCEREIPMLIGLEREFRPKGLSVIGISAEPRAVVKTYLDERRLDFRNVVDEGKTVWNLYGIDLVPRVFVIDRRGIIVRMLRGAPGEGSIRKVIEPLLEAGPATNR